MPNNSNKWSILEFSSTQEPDAKGRKYQQTKEKIEKIQYCPECKLLETESLPWMTAREENLG